MFDATTYACHYEQSPVYSGFSGIRSPQKKSAVKANRSIPPVTVIPVLTYPDVRAAVGWLASAFGAVEHVRIGEDHRAQMSIGGGAFIVADSTPTRRPPVSGEPASVSIMVRVEDVRAHCARARAAGATIVDEPTDHMYGERQYSAEDLAGHHWTCRAGRRSLARYAYGVRRTTPRSNVVPSLTAIRSGASNKP